MTLYQSRIVGFQRLVNGVKDGNPTIKSCTEYFQYLRLEKMKNLDGGF